MRSDAKFRKIKRGVRDEMEHGEYRNQKKETRLKKEEKIISAGRNFSRRKRCPMRKGIEGGIGAEPYPLRRRAFQNSLKI